jgi:hypothetical protein
MDQPVNRILFEHICLLEKICHEASQLRDQSWYFTDTDDGSSEPPPTIFSFCLSTLCNFRQANSKPA